MNEKSRRVHEREGMNMSCGCGRRAAYSNSAPESASSPHAPQRSPSASPTREGAQLRPPALRLPKAKGATRDGTALSASGHSAGMIACYFSPFQRVFCLLQTTLGVSRDLEPHECRVCTLLKYHFSAQKLF